MSYGRPHRLRRLISHTLQLIATAILLNCATAYAATFSTEGFTTERVAGGLTLPTAVAFHTDGRIFIAQKNGVVRVVENGQLLPDAFIELADVNNHRDRGLLGIAIDPDFDSNGFVYLAYTYENNAANPTGPKTARVVRYTANGNTALIDSAVVVLGTVGGSADAPQCADFPPDADCIASDSITHTVGGIRFGPDNKLYVATGDGADFIGTDMRAFRAQDLDNLSGKILRIDTDGRGIADNPFYTGNASDIRSKVWAYGFRNPYRFNFHPLDGRLLAGDVGWSLREEINLVTPGGNYGWPCREGLRPAGGGYPNLQMCAGAGDYTDPVHDYPHADNRGAVTGGTFATSALYPPWLQGSYVFADFSFGNMQVLTLDDQNRVASVTELATDVGGPVEIVTAPDGLIYYLSIYRGELLRVVSDNDTTVQPPEVNAAFITSNAAPLSVRFDASESRDPNGGPLTFHWDFGDGNTGTDATPEHTYSNSGSYQVVVTATTQTGLSGSTSLNVTVADGPVSDSQPFIDSLMTSQDPKYLGSVVEFKAVLGNTTDGDAFAVQFEIVDSNDQNAGNVWLKPVQIAAGDTLGQNFSWLPTGLGTYYINVGFYRTSTTHQIQPVVERVIQFKVVARTPPKVIVGVGTLDLRLLAAVTLCAFLLLWLRAVCTTPGVRHKHRRRP